MDIFFNLLFSNPFCFVVLSLFFSCIISFIYYVFYRDGDSEGKDG